MKRILFVSHCLLNPAAKVRIYKPSREDALRKQFLHRAIDADVQLIQLPCPEFLQYGSQRWGHTKEQFDHPFFRQRCREMLQPILLQLQEYLQHPEEFEVLGFLGIDGSPSCGVKYTCRGEWGGEFSGRDVSSALKTCRCAEGPGVMVEVFREMLSENGIPLPMTALFPDEPERAFGILPGPEHPAADDSET